MVDVHLLGFETSSDLASCDGASEDRELIGWMAEAFRLRLLTGVENQLRTAGFQKIAGVDEAGRGCLAGPVVVAAVIVDGSSLVPGVDDSKKLGPAQRALAAPVIESAAVATAVTVRSAAVIDRINVLEATREAMVEALERLEVAPDVAIVDAVPLRARCPVLSLVRGDALSYAVASASILAKWHRDQLMETLDRRFPGYGFAANKGYGAPRHRQALIELGPTPVHRLTFRSVVPRKAMAKSRV